MFKISYQQLRDNDFLSAMQKISNCPDFHDVKVSYNIMRTAKLLEAKLKDTQKEWVELANPMIESKDGRFLNNNGAFVWKDGVNAEEAEKKIAEFFAKECIIERHKIKLEDLAPAKLTPSQLGAIEPLLSEVQLQAAAH